VGLARPPDDRGRSLFGTPRLMALAGEAPPASADELPGVRASETKIGTFPSLLKRLLRRQKWLRYVTHFTKRVAGWSGRQRMQNVEPAVSRRTRDDDKAWPGTANADRVARWLPRAALYEPWRRRRRRYRAAAGS